MDWKNLTYVSKDTRVIINIRNLCYRYQLILYYLNYINCKSFVTKRTKFNKWILQLIINLQLWLSRFRRILLCEVTLAINSPKIDVWIFSRHSVAFLWICIVCENKHKISLATEGPTCSPTLYIQKQKDRDLLFTSESIEK